TESDRERHILLAGQSYIQDLAKVEELTIPGTAETQQPPSSAETPNQVASAKEKGNIKISPIFLPFLLLLPLLFLVGTAVIAVATVAKQILGTRVSEAKQVGATNPPSTVSPPEPASPAEADMPQAIAGVVGTVQVSIPLAGVVDVDALRAKLEKNLNKVEAEAKALSGRLSNAKFVDKAPADVVKGARDTLAEAEKQAEILRERLARL
ncbi:MAG: valine--tRNA ligase, partial [Cyanobacteriota bacterium]